jgi:RecB family exonuclease
VPLTLVIGPANSAKAGEVLGAFAAAGPRGALLVLPTVADVEHYTRELAGDGVILGSILTFGGLVGEIGRRAPYQTRPGRPARRLSSLQRSRVLQRVLRGLSMEALAASADAPGFATAAGELIAELARELVTPQRLTVALRAWAAQDVRRASYARDVGRIYAGYVRELDRLGRVDRELYAWRALDALRGAPQRWGGDSVHLYGFDDLTPLERDAVETLARVVGADVTVSLTYEPGREALGARAGTVEALRPLAARVLELPAQDEHYAPGSRATLHHLERSLFGAGVGAGRVEAGTVVELLEAGGERAEAELVGQRIAGLLAAGMGLGEIVVVHRSPRRIEALLGRVLAQYGIPPPARREREFGHTPLGRAVLGAARCAWLDEDEARAQDLLDYLRAPGLLEHPEIADGLEADVSRGGLRTAAQARRALGWELPELEALAGAADRPAALYALARRLLAAPHRARAPRLTAREEVDARALAALAGAVAELAELAELEPGLARMAAAELVDLLHGLPVAGGRVDADTQILLAEPLAIRARRFRAVFVCGLQEGEFPASARPEPFLSDEVRFELAAASGLALGRREDALAAERYLFYAAVSRATERVFLSYRSSDEEGNLALPSPFIDDVAELLDPGWRERRGRRLLADVVWEPAQAPTGRELARSLAAAGAPAAGEDAPPRRVLGAAALAGVRHSRILSAGALETYGDCPVKWLVERELAPARLTPEPDPITRGNLMHGTLERLLRELGRPLTPATLDDARAILDRLIAELAATPEAAPAAGSPAVVRAGALRAIEADLRRYLGHEAVNGAGWRPLGVELRFGFTGEDGDSLPALALGEGAQRILLRGMIDRVDVDDRGHALVYDYKSGASRPEHHVARWGVDRRLQVALYMLVVRDLLGLDPAGGFYQSLRGESLRPRGVFVKDAAVGAGVAATDGRSAAELEALLADAAQRAVSLATALRAGELTPCPQTCSREGCAFPGICRGQ